MIVVAEPYRDWSESPTDAQRRRGPGERRVKRFREGRELTSRGKAWTCAKTEKRRRSWLVSKREAEVRSEKRSSCYSLIVSPCRPMGSRHARRRSGPRRCWAGSEVTTKRRLALPGRCSALPTTRRRRDQLVRVGVRGTPCTGVPPGRAGRLRSGRRPGPNRSS